MNEVRHCRDCRARLVKGKHESRSKFASRVTCGMTCPKRGARTPDVWRTRPATPKRGRRPKGLPPVLVQIAAEHPELAEAIHEVVTRPWNPREAGRWY